MLPVSLVIPTLNEADNILYVLSRAKEAAQIIVVDGGSTDGTVERIRTYAPHVEVIVDHTPGKGNAMRVGFKAATQPYIIAMDGDGSMDPAEMPNIISLMQQGYQFVKGSRRLGDSHDLTWFRCAGNRFLTTYFNMVHGTKYTDLCYGYFAIQRDSLNYFDIESTGFEVEAELVSKATRQLDVAEFPSVEYARLNGTSNLRPVRDGFRVLKAIRAHRTSELHIRG